MKTNEIKTYQNAKGYKIRATEKAYNLFYKKQGFKLVEEAGKKNASVKNDADTSADVSEESNEDEASKTADTEDLEAKPVEKWSVSELREALAEAGIEFDSKATKKDLIALLQKQED